MIFKTYENDLDGISNKLGFGKRSFAEWGTQVKTSFNEGVTYVEKFKNALQAMFVVQSSKNNDNWLRTDSGDIVSKNNIDSFIPKLDTDSARTELENLQNIQKKINETKDSWDDYNNQFLNGRKYLLDYAKSNNVLEASVDNVKEANQSAREAAIAHNEALEQQTLGAKAATLATKALAAAGNMLVMWGIGKAVETIYNCATASDRLKESASDLGSQFSSTKSDIEDYKSQIEDLYKVINDDTSSYEDTYNARQNLLSLQDEMIEKFGNEAEAVSLVTTAINGQVEALDRLTENEWLETLNKFNNDSDKSWTEKLGDNWANLWSGTSNNFDRMIKEMENTQVSFHIVPLGDESYKEFSKKLKEDFGASLTKTDRDDMFTLSGNLEDIYEQLLNIQSLANSMGIDDSFLPDLSRQTEEAKDTLEGYQEIYNQHILYNKIFNDDAYEETFNKINDAYKKYQEAFAKGNDETIANAKQQFAEIVQGATEGIDDQSVVDYFNSMYPDLQEVVGGWEFEVKFNAAIDDDKDNFENEIKDAISKFSTIENIQNYSPENATDEQIDAYLQLKTVADKYGLTLDQLISKMTQMGLIQSQIKEDLLDKLIPSRSGLSAGIQSMFEDSFSQVNSDVVTEWVKSLTEEEAKLANSKEFQQALEEQKENLNGAALSAENYETALQNVKDVQEQMDATEPEQWDYSTTITQLDALKEKFNILDSTLSKLYDTDESTVIGFDDFSSINEAFQDLDGIETYIQRLQEAGQDTEAVTAVMSDLISAYLEYSGVLDNVTDENRQLITSMLEEMGVANAKEAVYDTLNAETQALALQEQFLADNGSRLVNASNAKAAGFLTEAGASETVRNYLMLLSAQENIFSNQGLNVTEKIARLKELAKEYGNTALAASIAAKMEAASENAALGQTGYTFEDAFNEAKAEFESSASAVNIDFKGTDVSAAVSSGSAAGDAYTDAFEKELDELDSLKDRGIITEKEYLDTLRSLYERYFKDRAGYLDEYKKYERQYLEGMKSLYDSALSGISKLMGSRIDALTQSKEAAVAGLEAQQAAAEAAYQAQIDDIQTQIDAIDSLIDEKNKQVDAINEEIDKINEASKARKREIDLQKAQYELERMQNQRTTLQYTEGKGMHYVQDTGGVRDAREAVTGIREEIQVAELEKQISLIEKEIDLLEGRKDALKSQQDALRQMMDESNNYYDTLIKQQENYWNSLIQNLEQQKSKWEQLAEIEEIANAYSRVQQVFGSMGYTIEDILNGNEQAFEDFKSRYTALLSDLNPNEAFREGLDKMNQLGADAGDGFIAGWNEKSGDVLEATKQTAIDAANAFAEGQDSHSPSAKYQALAVDAIDGLLLGIEEKKQTFIDSVRSLAEESVLAFKEGFSLENTSLLTPFDSLKLLIETASEALGLNKESTIGGLSEALEKLSIFSLEDTDKGSGIISQFSILKNAVDEVTNAISGGGSGSSPGNGSSPSGTGMNTGTAKSGTGGLTGAMDALKSAADEALGSPDGSENAKGSGAIGKFEQLKAAVDDAAGSIGTGGENSGTGTEAGGDDTGSNDTGTLTGAVISMGETARETLGESGGEGVIGKFEEFSDVISKANEHVTGIFNGLKAIDGQEAECTIKIHIEQYGSTIGGAAMAAGTALNAMNLSSAAYSARYGNSLARGTAHFEGAALASGSWAVQSNAAKALMGELGYEIIVRNGRFFTVCENGAGIVPIKKGDIVFNHKQSEQLLKYGHISGRGRAYADGTVGSPLASGRLLPLADDHPSMELQRKFSAYMDKVTRNLDELIFPVNEIHKNMGNMSNVINNLNTINTTANQITINKLDLSCPNVTNSSGIEYIQKELGHLSLRALQEPAGN